MNRHQKILEHALVCHDSGSISTDAILAGVDFRRIEVFEVAFGLRKFSIAKEILLLIREKPKNVKFRLKIFCVMAYDFFRHVLRLKDQG